MSQSWNEIKNLTVEEFTTPCPTVVSPDTEITEVERIMQKENIRHIPVQQEDKLVGIISERDAFFSYRKGGSEAPTLAKDIMHTNIYIVDSSTKLSEVAFNMSKHKYGSALVTSPEGELGIFTSIDALNALVEIIRGDFLSS